MSEEQEREQLRAEGARLRAQVAALERQRDDARSEAERVRLALEASEQRHRITSELISDYVYSLELAPDGTITRAEVSDTFGRVTGHTSELLTSHERWLGAVHPEDRPLVNDMLRRMRAGEPTMTAYRLLTRSGSALWLNDYNRPIRDPVSGQVVRVYGAAQDVTSLKELQQQLLHTQKLEALGHIAGAVAHDFNNLLTVITGSCALVLDRLPPLHPLRFDIDQIGQAADRAAVLTAQLLSLVRPRSHQPRVIDLNQVVRSSEGLLRHILGATIALTLDLDPKLRPIEADPAQLEQVLLNLVVNARDAMPSGGVIRIQTALALCPPQWAAPEGVRDATVILRISDTGEGMDWVTLEQIFKPFFTTKPPGEGTGLGLAIVHSIVVQNGGQIRVSSQPGQGTAFTIMLPQALTGLTEPSADVAPSLPPPAGETILVIEDEPLVRELAARVLRARGYDVLVAEDAAAAVVLAARPRPIDLLLVDSTLYGGLSGRQLAEQLRAQLPALKVLYMSGYPSSLMVQRGMLDAEQPFLPKPFTPQLLLRRVWEILHRSEQAQ